MKQEEHINIIAIFNNLYRYKWAILTILTFTLIATYFCIKQLTPIYSSHMLIEIGSSKTSNIDLFQNNYGNKEENTESLVKNEIKILNSYVVISKVLKKVDISKQFFIVEKWKSIELYKKKIPFKITFKSKNSNIDSFIFLIQELDNENFTLILKNKNEEKKDKTYKLKYNQLIETENYKLKIEKKKFHNSILGTNYKIKINNNKESLISHISNNLSVTKEVGKIIRISYEDTIPQRAKDIVQQIFLSYKNYDLITRRMKDIKNIDFLNKRIVTIENTLKNIGNQLKKYKLEHNELLILGSEDKIFSNTLEKNNQIDLLSNKLNALRTTRKRIENGIYSISLLENSNLRVTEINKLITKIKETNRYLNLIYQQKENLNTLIINNLAYSNIFKKFTKTKEELYELRLIYTDKHPEVQHKIDTLNLLQRELDKYLIDIINQSNIEIIDLKENIYKTIDVLIESIEEKYNSIKKSIKTDNIKIKKLPSSIMKLNELKRTFKINEKIYERLLQKRNESLISKESTISNIQVIDNATISNSPIKPKKNFIYLSALIVGLIISMVFSSIRTYRNPTIHSKDDIPPVDDYFLIYDKKDTEKSFWRLITYIEKKIPLNESKIMLISANDYGENKSIVLQNLSLKIAKLLKKVIIIDFDVFYPNLTESLKLKSSIGLSTFLTTKHPIEEIDINDYIKEIDVSEKYKNIDILPSGPILPNGSSLLFNSKVPYLIEKLSKQYDYILIDTPPVGKYPEVNILLSYVNIFLVVAKIDKTDKSLFEKLNDNQEEDMEKIIFLNI
ncbi:Tyrosine-protein kinase EpsD [hydrothermal vent metagenome]|uniref:Tyrosine-protein kinase EpsD n=1 Tax=hydrothermal vent metagenome TaxID=652676 RepID=A0A1W1C1D6_9ZZZZ